MATWKERPRPAWFRACAETNSPKALDFAQQSLQLWQSANNKLGMAQVYLVLGEFQMAQHKLVESGQSLQSALDLWRELNVPRKIAESLIYLGFNEYRKGAWQSSLTFHTQAEQLTDPMPSLLMGQIKAGLAESFVESGLFETGLEKYRQTLDYYRLTKKRARNTPWSCASARFITFRAIILKRCDVGKARSEAVNYDYQIVIALSDDFLGRTYYELNDYPAALRHYQAALDTFTETERPMEAARTVALIGQLYQQQGEHRKARTNYQKALLAFQKLSDEINEAATALCAGSFGVEAESR